MDNKLTMHMSTFNDRVRAMNQMNKPNLSLTAVEANNLLSDIFAVLAQVTELSQAITNSSESVVEVQVNGGGFK